MRKIEAFIGKKYLDAMRTWTEFVNSERGDTNFVSMLLIIGIIVVLAGLFLTFGKGVMTSITTKVTQFIQKL